jgi:SAM-dependent methyltransferase
MEHKFSNIYSKNKWGGSGSGSNYSPDNKWYLKQLRTIIDNSNIKSIADLGCGDWELMKHFNFNEDEKYTGIDVVDFLIDSHNEKYSNENIKFIHQDISQEVPSGYDLVIIKDVLQHWEDEYILKQLPKILENNKYVYCINGYKFCRDPTKNNWKKRELDKQYSYHPINFDKEPFTEFKKYIIETKNRRAKQYILFKHTI